MRRTPIALAALLFVGPAAAAPPNVVLIYADDLGWGDLGCYGGPPVTPRLDKLASEGARLTHFTSAQPVCSASRAALLSGCYPNRLGIHGALSPKATTGVHPDEELLPERLRDAGYATAMVGKWHLGSRPAFLPTRHGFGSWLGLPYSNDMWPERPDVKPGSYPPLPLYDGERVTNPRVTADDQATLTSRYTARAVEFIGANRDKPFFLYVAHTFPHVPLFAGAEFRGKTGRGLYADVLAEIDASVGAVLDALTKAGVADNTVVIFSSDNGPWLNYGDHAGSAGPLREGKGTCWEGGVRVPCVVRYPGVVPAGAVIDAPLMTIDLLPTLCAWAGAKPGRPTDGKDARDLLAGKAAAGPQEAYFFYYNVNELHAVRSGAWKLVLPHQYRTLAGRPGGAGGVPAKYSQAKVSSPELYHLYDDVGERRDRAAERPADVARLLALAERARVDLGDALTGRPGAGRRVPGRVAE